MLTRTLSFALFLVAVSSQAAIPPLGIEERDELRYHLQNLYNEMDLLIRNEHSDQADLRRQEREFDQFKVFERVPFHRDYRGLEASLAVSAKEYGISQLKFYALPVSTHSPRPVPRSVYTDNQKFHISPEQIAEALPFRIIVQGDAEKIRKWATEWPQVVMRLVEPSIAPIQLQGSRWRIDGVAYRYREVKFPTLIPKDPVELLPAAARVNPKAFASQEPLLWGYVEKIRALKPRTPPLYESRGRFLLEGARMEFFLRKVTKRPNFEARR